MIHYKGDLKHITFDNLIFKEPFTEKSQLFKRIVFFPGIDGKAGIIVVEYIDLCGSKHYGFHTAKNCLYRSAQSTYAVLKGSGCSKIRFSFICCPPRSQSRVLKKLKKEVQWRSITDHFQKLQPWLTGKKRTPPPLSIFSFERPYIIDEKGVKRWNFMPYIKRAGAYVFLEKDIQKNETVIANVGMSTTLRKRILYKFFPNHYLYYKDQPGVLEYSVAVIDLPRREYPTKKRCAKKAVEVEDLLIKLLDPRDNIKGKEKVEIDRTGAWRPMKVRGFKGF